MIGDDLAEVLPELRAEALSMMRDTCDVDRPRLGPDGKPVRTMDPDTLEYVDVFDPVVVDGACRVKPAEMQANPTTVGEMEFTTAQHVVWRPIDATVYREGDRVTMKAVDPVVGDPALVGRVLWVVNDPMRSQGTKRELACTEVRPGG
jgi:hypothetical protein